MKQSERVIYVAANAFVNLYSALDEISKDEHSLEGAKASQIKKYMELAGLHDKAFLLEFIKNDIWRN